MYCVKCKLKTETNNVQHVMSKNRRPMKRGVCGICGSVKTQFTKVIGNGMANSLINNLPFEMHLPGHNFTGPGTKLHNRLNPDGTPKPWSIPINRVDEAAYRHDICYSKHKDSTTRNQLCDRNMLTELGVIVNPSLRERMEKSIVEKIIATKVNFGMGLKKKKSSTGLTI